MNALPKPIEELNPRIKRKPEKVYMRVIKGSLVPADSIAEQQLRDKKFKVGQIVGVIIRKLRNPKFNRLVHRLGKLCVKHIDDFKNMDAHAALKRIQIEGNICCDEVAIKPAVCALIPDSVIKTLKPVLELFGLVLTENGLLIARVPRSLSFESMDEDEYHDAAKRISRHIAEVYWPSCTPEGIEQMAECSVDE